MKQQSFHQSISIFTCRIWLHYNNLRGDTRHSYLNDFANDIRQVNHHLGHRSLMNMIKEYRMNSAFKNVLIYDNINNVPVYDEVFVQSQNKYRVRLNCNCIFQQDEKGNYFYQGFESYDQETGELILNQADQEKVRTISKAAYEFLRKRKSMPGIVHPEARQNQTQQGKVQIESVQSIQDRLRDEKIFAGLSPEQLSAMADMLIKQRKGVRV